MSEIDEIQAVKDLTMQAGLLFDGQPADVVGAVLVNLAAGWLRCAKAEQEGQDDAVRLALLMQFLRAVSEEIDLEMVIEGTHPTVGNA